MLVALYEGIVDVLLHHHPDMVEAFHAVGITSGHAEITPDKTKILEAVAEGLGIEPAYSPAGSAGNVLDVYAKLGGDARAITAVGDDDNGRIFKTAMRGSNLDLILAQVPDNATTNHVYVTTLESGDRIMGFCPGTSNDCLKPELLNSTSLREADLFLVESYLLNAQHGEAILDRMSEHAREKNIPIVLLAGSGGVMKNHQEYVADLLSSTPITFVGNNEEAEALASAGGHTGEAERYIQELLSQSPGRIASAVVTASGGNVQIILPDTIEEVEVDRVPDDKIVSTVGAGDNFTGGMLFYMWARGQDVPSKEAVEFGHLFGAAAVQQEGPHLHAPKCLITGEFGSLISHRPLSI